MVLPMLVEDKNLVFYNRLVNCFIASEEYTDKIILVYRWDNGSLYSKFKEALKQFRNFIKLDDINNEFSIFTFDVPKKYLKDYQNFLDGKYSKFSDEYKQRVLNFNDSNKQSSLGQILYQDPKRRKRMERELGIELNKDSELLSIIDYKIETLNTEYYGIQQETR